MRKTFIISLCLITFLRLRAQKSDIFVAEVGKKISNYEFSNCAYYKSKKVSIYDLRGKWLIIDFWSRTCASCISEMPYQNTLQEKYSKSVQILLVGLDYNFTYEYEKASNPDLSGSQITHKLYETVRERSGVTLPVAWDTSLYNKVGGYGGVPLIIVVDPLGTVRAITTKVDEADIEALLANKNPKFPDYFSRNGQIQASNYNMDLPLLVSGNQANGGIDSVFIYRALLSRWTEGLPYFDFNIKGRTAEVIGAPILMLYKIAFTGKRSWGFGDSLFGKYYNQPLAEVADPSVLASESKRFCYSLTLSDLKNGQFDIQLFQSIMQRDLGTLFPYKAAIEVRKMPFYRLTKKEGMKLRFSTKGGNRISFFSFNGLKLVDFPFNEFVQRLLLIRTRDQGCYVSNETGIEGNVDLFLEANMSDVQDIQKSIGKLGLVLERDFMDMKVIVIRDR